MGYNNNNLVQEFATNQQQMYAKIFIYKNSDFMKIQTSPLVSIPLQLKLSSELHGQDFHEMLKEVLDMLTPAWLKEEFEKGEDPEDKTGHMMYFVSMVVVQITRSWKADELNSMNDSDQFNTSWRIDLWEVLKNVWNNGNCPMLENLRAEYQHRIPGSDMNMVLLALLFGNLLKPRHGWVAWTCWRTLPDKEAKQRQQTKQENEINYTKLHYLCCHQNTKNWFDVRSFWEKDPNHKCSPDPDVANTPHPQKLDLAKHTQWLRTKADSTGYNCPLKVRGVIPPILEKIVNTS